MWPFVIHFWRRCILGPPQFSFSRAFGRLQAGKSRQEVLPGQLNQSDMNGGPSFSSISRSLLFSSPADLMNNASPGLPTFLYFFLAADRICKQRPSRKQPESQKVMLVLSQPKTSDGPMREHSEMHMRMYVQSLGGQAERAKGHARKLVTV